MSKNFRKENNNFKRIIVSENGGYKVYYCKGNKLVSYESEHSFEPKRKNETIISKDAFQTNKQQYNNSNDEFMSLSNSCFEELDNDLTFDDDFLYFNRDIPSPAPKKDTFTLETITETSMFFGRLFEPVSQEQENIINTYIIPFTDFNDNLLFTINIDCENIYYVDDYVLIFKIPEIKNQIFKLTINDTNKCHFNLNQ